MLDNGEHDRESLGTIEATGITRRGFLTRTALAVGGMMTAAADAAQSAEAAKKTDTLPALPNPQDLPNKGRPIKIFTCDFNWCVWDKPSYHVTLSAPQDWAFVNPEEYFNWHRASASGSWGPGILA